MSGLQVVSPYRPFTPVSQSHRLLGPFDWVDALRMMGQSVERACGCKTYAITDVDTSLPVPAFAFQTDERRLMLWILEVSLRFLESAHFDRDTVMLCPDALVFADLSVYFTGADLGLIIRPQPKYKKRPLLNAAQFWAVAGRDRLIDLYAAALALGKTLPDNVIEWGADTVPFVKLLKPLEVGIHRRGPLTVNMIVANGVMESITGTVMKRLDLGLPLDGPMVPIVDFKYLRKQYQRAFFDATVGAAVPA